MAKPLGPKTRLIRDAIMTHPTMSPKELADLINGSDARKLDKIEVKPFDISQQKQLLKKLKKLGQDGALPEAAAAEPAARKLGRPKGKGGRPRKVASTSSQGSPAAAGNPVDLIDRVFGLAQECGGFAALKRLVDRIAEMQGR